MPSRILSTSAFPLDSHPANPHPDQRSVAARVVGGTSSRFFEYDFCTPEVSALLPWRDVGRTSVLSELRGKCLCGGGVKRALAEIPAQAGSRPEKAD